MAVLQIRNLTKKFGKITAVNNLSMCIDEGQIVGFVGKNGAGKSTTIRCLMNMISPTSGECIVLNLNAQTQHKAIGKLTGYMPSDAMFPAGVTAKELFALCTSFSGIDEAEVLKLAEYFELDITKPISKLSLGNRKKVSIIQALLKPAKLLILDEPTSGLDPLMQEKFFTLLKERTNNGLTVFLSSHNLMEVERYCDRVFIIKDGILQDEINMQNANLQKTHIVTYTLKDGTEHKITHTGDINELVSTLSTLELATLEVRYASVHEEFIKYYKEDL